MKGYRLYFGNDPVMGKLPCFRLGHISKDGKTIVKTDDMDHIELPDAYCFIESFEREYPDIRLSFLEEQKRSKAIKERIQVEIRSSGIKKKMNSEK